MYGIAKKWVIRKFYVTFTLTANMKEISRFSIRHFLVWTSPYFGWKVFEMVMRFTGSSGSNVENKNLGSHVQMGD